jgi:hypothetical protein
MYLYYTSGGRLGYMLIPFPIICLKIGNAKDILILGDRQGCLS